MRGARWDMVVRIAAAVAAALVVACGMAYGLAHPAPLMPPGGPEDALEEELDGGDAPDQDSDGQQDEALGDDGDQSDEVERPDAGHPSQWQDALRGAPSEGDMADLVARIDDYLDANVAATHEPGVAVALVDADGTRLARTFGDYRSIHDASMVGSLSKSFTALCVMQLAEQGRIDLDAPASAYVDDPQVPDDVTVRSLLNQTSGFGYYDSLQDARPGVTQGSFSYSNANYDLLGRIVERVSGEPYADYLAEHVLAPLGMGDTSASVDARARALGRRNYFGLAVADGFVHDDGDAAWGQAPSGYVSTSVSDMAAYLRMYLNQGLAPSGGRVLGADGIRDMFMSRVPDPGGDTFYGMGWTSYYLADGELVLSHDGQVENGVARMCLLPERGIGLVVMADQSDYYGGNGEFFDLADGLVEIATAALPLPIDGGAYVWGHVQEDAELGLVVLLAVLPLAYIRRWKEGLAHATAGQELLRLVAVHIGLPAALIVEPVAQGYLWRDVATFVPDVALTLAGSAALLAATGVAKAAIWARWSRKGRAGRPDAGPRAAGADAPGVSQNPA